MTVLDDIASAVQSVTDAASAPPVGVTPGPAGTSILDPFGIQGATDAAKAGVAKITDQATQTAAQAQSTLQNVNQAAASAQDTLNKANEAIKQVQQTASDAETGGKIVIGALLGLGLIWLLNRKKD